MRLPLASYWKLTATGTKFNVRCSMFDVRCWLSVVSNQGSDVQRSMGTAPASGAPAGALADWPFARFNLLSIVRKPLRSEWSNALLGRPRAPGPAGAPWDSEPLPDWGTMQALPFQYSSAFRAKYLIDNPESKRILSTTVF